IEDGVIIKCVPNLLKFLEELLQDVPFDRISRDEVEDQTVFSLAVAMNAAHALFKAVRIPGDIVIEQDVTALQVNSFTCGLSGDQYLDDTLLELLFGIQAWPGFVAGTGLHATVNGADAEAPLLEAVNKVVKR